SPAGEQPFAVRRKRYRAHITGMSLEDLHLLARGRFPHADRVVVAGDVETLLRVDTAAGPGGNVLAVGGERHAPDDVAVPLEAAHLAARRQAPQDHGAQLVAGEGVLAVGREGDTVDRARQARNRPEVLVGAQVPEHQLRAAAQGEAAVLRDSDAVHHAEGSRPVVAQLPDQGPRPEVPQDQLAVTAG